MKTLLIIIILTLFSCSTVHKIFDKHHEKIDSTGVNHFDSLVLKHIDTTKVQNIFSKKENSVEIELVDSGIYIKGDTENTDKGIYASPDDYWTYHVRYDKKTGEVKSTQPIKKVTITESSGVAYSNFSGGIDSSLIKINRSDSVHEKKNETIIHQTVDRKGMSIVQKILIVLGLIIALAIFIFIMYLRKKKQTIQDVINKL